MTDIRILTICFIIVMFLLLLEEKNRIQKIITPFSATAIPFILVIFFTNFFLVNIKFPPITIRVQLFILFMMVLIWGIGFIISYFINYNKSSNTKFYETIGNEYIEHSNIIIFISWISIIIIFYRIFSLFSSHGGWTYFGNPKYEEEMISGFTSHIIQFGRASFIYLIFLIKSKKKKIFIFITLCFLSIVILLVQVKYHILWLILMVFIFFNLEKKPKIQIKNMIYASIALLIIFNIVWILLKISWGNFGIANKFVYIYISDQTINYFFTGTMNLNNWLNYPEVKPDWTLVVVFKNFFNVIIGNPIRYNFVPLVSLGFEKLTPTILSNVGTAYGTFYLIGGYYLTIAYVILSSFVYYLIYFMSFIKQNYMLIFLNLMFLTITTLSFFGQYYTSLSTFEFPLIFLSIGIICKLRSKIIHLFQSCPK